MKKTNEKAIVTLPSDREVKVVRAFDAPRDLVYKAYTTPALVQRWLLGPSGWTMPVCEMDLRVGGTYRYRWRSIQSGKEFGFHGVYQEVQPPAKLVHTEFFDPGDVGGNMGEGAVVTLEFAEADGHTTVTSLIDYGNKRSRDAAVATGMTSGMEQSFQLLDALLAPQ
jgi:uncharacterized protein YndB with AHSA1/START domain